MYLHKGQTLQYITVTIFSASATLNFCPWSTEIVFQLDMQVHVYAMFFRDVCVFGWK